jgi:hypothetical protein
MVGRWHARQFVKAETWRLVNIWIKVRKWAGANDLDHRIGMKQLIGVASRGPNQVHFARMDSAFAGSSAEISYPAQTKIRPSLSSMYQPFE